MELENVQPATPLDAAEPMAVNRRYEMQFTGTGSEYFRIWIVNVLLSIITLGIYSAWAKVRREQYFHRNTVLDGSAFEYHGNPLSILKGRILVFAVIGFAQFLGQLAPALSALTGLLIVLGTPWIICQALRFKTWNSSWRGVRFNFHGKPMEMVKVYCLNGLLVLATLGLAFPWWLNRFQTYALSKVGFGTKSFAADPPVGEFYKAFFGVIGISFILNIVVMGICMAIFGTSSLIMAVVLPYAVFYVVSASYLKARLSNSLWNHTKVETTHFFASELKATQLAKLVISNGVLTLLTLGLFFPFAKVRMAKYRAETFAITGFTSLDDFVAEQAAETQAIGDQAADFLDIDLGF